MSDYVQFEAVTPNVVPASNEVVYDKYWMSNMMIMAQEPTKNVRLIATFKPARDVTVEVDGKTVEYKELMPNGKEKQLVIKDLFGDAAKDPTGLGATLNSVLTILKDRAIAENLL